MAMAACSSDDLVVEQNGGGNNNGTIGEEVEAFTSSFVDNYVQLGEEDLDNGTITRAGVNSTMDATWDVGDEVCISNGTLIFSYDVKSTTDEGRACTFKLAGEHKAFNAGIGFNAIYPRRAVTECDGGKWNGNVVTAQVYAQQSYSENTADVPGHDNHYFGGYYVTKEQAGMDEDKEGVFKFSFMPLCSVIDLDLSGLVLEDGDQIAAAYIRNNNGKSIAGHFEYNFAEHTLMTTGAGGCKYNYSSRSTVVEVNFFHEEVDGKVFYDDIKDDKIVRFYVLPVKMTEGVTVTVRTKNGKYYTKTSSNPVGKETSDVVTTEDGDMVETTEKGDIVGTLAKPYYKRFKFGSKSTAKLGAWMACIPDNIFYTMLSIPGSHDAATASAKILSGSSKTQTTSIIDQLKSGVRAFDMRPCAECYRSSIFSSYTEYKLEIRHGSVGTDVYFKTVVNQIADYLGENPTECAFVFIHMEQPTSIFDAQISDDDHAGWSYEVYNYIKGLVDAGKALTSISKETKFNECRGKIIFVLRDDYKTGIADKLGRTLTSAQYYTCRIPWNDNIARTVWVRGNDDNYSTLKVSYQDIYNTDKSAEFDGDIGGGPTPQKGGITGYADKIALIKEFINSATNTSSDRFVLNFASFAGVGNPEPNAAAIMPEINLYIQQQHENVGIIFSDFVNSEYGGLSFTTVTLSNNFKHCFMNRSRVDQLKKYTSDKNIGLIVSGDDYADESDVFVKKRKF